MGPLYDSGWRKKVSTLGGIATVENENLPTGVLVPILIGPRIHQHIAGAT